MNGARPPRAAMRRARHRGANHLLRRPGRTCEAGGGGDPERGCAARRPACDHRFPGTFGGPGCAGEAGGDGAARMWLGESAAALLSSLAHSGAAVTVVASAASEVALHPALTTDGLIDSTIRLTPPDRRGRATLLGALAARRGLRCPRRAALEAAASTEGWVARDLAALLERAELVALTRALRGGEATASRNRPREAAHGGGACGCARGGPRGRARGRARGSGGGGGGARLCLWLLGTRLRLCLPRDPCSRS